MPTTDSPYIAHIAQNVSLILLSILFLPLDTFVLLLSHVIGALFPARRSPDASPKTILVTGVGMTKGLALARLFHLKGHRVIGADFEPAGALVCGRVSRSLTRFYPLAKPDPDDSAPYVESLLSIIIREKVDLWVSCSGVASAVEDGEAKEIIEARTSCRAIQFDVSTTKTLHEKDSFMDHTKSIGLTIPETHKVTSREQVEEILRHASEGNGSSKEFIMKTVGVDDANRGDMTLLPRSSASETKAHIQRMRISEKHPWIIQQYIRGPEFCTHSLVVRGRVKAFVACPSAELLMHYVALPSDSPLSQAMLAFTRRYAESGGEGFTGHLSFDFLVRDEDVYRDRKEDITLYPIECNPRAHTAVVLFNNTPEMVDGYLDLLKSRGDQVSNGYLGQAYSVADPIFPRSPSKYYWIGHDLVTLVLLPLMECVLRLASIRQAAGGTRTFLGHLLTWKDGTYEMWDPLPWWWLYHVYWPMQFFNSIRAGKRWSRINVSTTKMFGLD